ncbi:MAG: hypothetical protein HXX20_02700, partial [Chloroflexi bacterium]|nr:hypothetical protein [Chloroflexota bacterium]
MLRKVVQPTSKPIEISEVKSSILNWFIIISLIISLLPGTTPEVAAGSIPGLRDITPPPGANPSTMLSFAGTITTSPTVSATTPAATASPGTTVTVTTTPSVPVTATTAPATPSTATTTPSVPVTATTAPATPVTATTTPSVPVTATTAPATPVTATTTPSVPVTATTAPATPITDTTPVTATTPITTPLPARPRPGAASPTLDKATDAPNPVPSGQFFNYLLSYNCASVNDPSCLNMVITDTLPAELSSLVGDVTLSQSSIDVQSFTFYPVTHTVVIIFNPVVPAGSTATLRIQVRFPNGSTPNGTVAANTAILGASNVTNTVFSNPVSVTASASPSGWTMNKVKTVGSDAGGYTTYNISLCPPATIGNGFLNLFNPIITDTLPTGAIFISGTNSPVYTAGPPDTVAWSYTGMVTTCRNENITLLYPTPTFTIGQTVTNTVNITHQPPGEPSPLPVGTASQPIILTTNNSTVSKTKTAGGIIGGTATYSVTLQPPTGVNAQVLVNPTMVDTLPIGATFVAASGTYTHTGGSPDTVVWYYPGVITAAKAETITIQYLTPPFTANEIVTNTVSVVHQPPNQTVPVPVGTASSPITLTGTTATITKTKTIGGDTGGYTTYSVQFCPPTGQSLYNPVMTDTLPTGATFISGTNSAAYTAGPPVAVVWSYAGTVSTCRSETITIQYPTANFTAGQIVTNTIDVTHQPAGQPVPIPVGTKNSPITLINNTGTVTKTLKSGGVIGGNTIYTVTLQSGSGQVLVNPIMTDTLPIGATFVTASGTYTHTGGSPDTVIWSYAGVISATKSETITVQYATPPFTSGEVVTNTVDLAHQPPGEPPTPLGTAIRPVTLTGTNAVVTKTKTIGGDAGGYTTYSVQFCPPAGQSLYNPVVTDTLPLNSIYISATNSPTHTVGSPDTVVWFYPGTISTCRSQTITIQYPNANFTVGQIVTNTIDVTHQPTG